MTNQTSNGAREPGSSVEYRGSETPFIREFFLVQGPTFRCMAYQDQNGKWRGAFNHHELPGQVSILA
jgi:hypothetical protein